MASLVDTFVAFDAATRAYAHAVGHSRASFEVMVEIAAAAGVDWHSMRDAINTVHARNPGR